MKRWKTILVTVAMLTVAASIAVAQQPRGEEPASGDRPQQRDRPNRKQRGPAQKAPAKTGMVTEFTKNPDGETDGLRLDDGTEVRFRPDAGEKVTAGVVSQGSGHDRRLDPFRENRKSTPRRSRMRLPARRCRR